MPRVTVLGNNESEVAAIVAAIAGLNYFVTIAWDLISLADAVAKGSPEVMVVDVRDTSLGLSELRGIISHYDQVAKAPRLAVVRSTDSPGLESRYFDDFVLFPYDKSELALRLTRLLMRTQKHKSGKLLGVGGLVVDTESFEVSSDGKKLSLTFKEFELLRYLAAHSGRVHTREALLNQVWGYEYFGGLRTVDVHVRRIRAKLAPRYQDVIETVHGVGYKFIGRLDEVDR